MKKTVITLAAVFALSTSALADTHGAWIAIVGYKTDDAKWLSAFPVSADSAGECKARTEKVVKNVVRRASDEGGFNLEARFFTCIGGPLELDANTTIRALEEMSKSD